MRNGQHYVQLRVNSVLCKCLHRDVNIIQLPSKWVVFYAQPVSLSRITYTHPDTYELKYSETRPHRFRIYIAQSKYSYRHDTSAMELLRTIFICLHFYCNLRRPYSQLVILFSTKKGKGIAQKSSIPVILFFFCILKIRISYVCLSLNNFIG